MSPPKPWETSTANSPSMTDSSTPPVPSRTTNDATLNRLGASSNTVGFGQQPVYGPQNRPYGTSSYGTSGYGSSYGTSGYGGYGSSYGTSGYGGYGSSYGTSGYGGYGGYGGMNSYNRMGSYGSPYGRPGMMNGGGPEDMGLQQRMEIGTRPAFEVVERIVGAFGGFAQMLDSTFMATHSSFMAMVGVAEQFGRLKGYLGQVFSIFALFRLFKRVKNRVTGSGSSEMNLSEFERFQDPTANAQPKLSKKPIMIFLFLVVGLPYMMHKLIQLINVKNQHELQQQQQQQQMVGAGGPDMNAKIDPLKLEFARALYDFAGESNMEISLKKGDIIAVLSKQDPTTQAVGAWWRGRLRDGTMGLFPANYVEIIQKGRQDPPGIPTEDTTA
ncbi:Peroxin 13, N-terminal region-domain-containing protein [Phycomyces nitens]|nr:Peroxin 13, N-terminal region-domain-containing protein [Phycomyces nitens]